MSANYARTWFVKKEGRGSTTLCFGRPKVFCDSQPTARSSFRTQSRRNAHQNDLQIFNHRSLVQNSYVSIRSLEERNHEWQHSTAPAKTFSRNSIFG